MTQQLLPDFPAFAQEVAATVTVHSQFILHGNIRDEFLVPTDPRPVPLLQVLWEALAPSGYQCLIVSDQVNGVSVYAETEQARSVGRQVLGRAVLGRKVSLERLRSVLARAAGVGEPPPIDAEAVQQEQRDDEADGPPASTDEGTPRVAFVIDYASRIARSHTNLDQDEAAFFLFCQKLADVAQTRAGGPPDRPAATFNPVIWLVDGERDLPAWFAAGSERIRPVAVAKPSLAERRTAATLFARILPGPHEPADLKAFADATDDMTMRAMHEVSRVAKDRGIGLASIKDAVRIYRLGIEENPWRAASVREQIINGQGLFTATVLGQEAAITRTLDILKRAALGLSGAQATSTGTRPKGTLFFAGPTGVGKTELAKQMAKVLFGDETAFLRFDMSEFSASHSADRLAGAPPGYVGFEAGGELTSAVRRKPFQVVLFDEIEKAHSQVMDKFLQILEDGRLTDGQGTTTYFSECVLIFTSNLGIIHTAKDGTKTELVKPPIGYAELEEKVTAAIKEHFTYEIGRPELLNRIGDNIVIFDFINPMTANRIVDLQLANIRNRLEREHRIGFELGAAADAYLRAQCTSDSNLKHGGRGIGNKLESRLINPLARYLFDHNCRAGTIVDIQDIHLVDGVAALVASHRQ